MASLNLLHRDTALKAITPGKAEESKLYRRIAGLDSPRMPYRAAPLEQAKIDTIKRWIEEGAPWGSPVAAEKPWIYRTPVAAKPPATGNPVDAFVNAKLAERGLKAAPRADHATLIRRLSLDLTGLPPDPADLQLTYDRAVEKYLASPHYGERWGRHWLDVARYADSNGYEHDFNRPNAWRYRDYTIRAFNDDKPFDRFLREQLAGDELDHPTHDSLIATGFLRNYAKVGFREKDNPQFRFEYLDDMIATLGRGVMGLTVQCARCHNHKFDAIAQADYLRMQATLWGYVEVDHPLTDKQAADVWRSGNAAVDAKVAAIRQELANLEKPYKDKLLPNKLKKFPPNVLAAIAVPEEKRTPGEVLLANQVLRTTNVSSAEAAKIMPADDLAKRAEMLDRIAALEKQRPAAIPLAMGITDGDFRFTPDGPGDEPAPGKGIKREAIEGSFLWQGPAAYKIPPGGARPGFPLALVNHEAPAAVPPSDGHTSGRRRALAEWLVGRDHPLTARVFVNRVWHHHFGRGIVPTIDNFGKQGDPPSHPELLDFLAVRFMEDGWSVKNLHRTILASEAYRRASNFDNETNRMKDPDNAYLWRFRMQRLEAEAVRDQVLAVAGTLNRAQGGEAIFPPLPAEILANGKNGVWLKQEEGPETWRRSVYVYRKRGLPFPFFEVFDLPDQNVTCGRRNTTTVPTQALTLLNNEFILQQSKLFAARVKEMSVDADRQIELAYRYALARQPDAKERAAAQDYLKSGSLDGLTHVLFNTSEFLYLR